MVVVTKEYIVIRIDAAPDGGPYVLVSLADPHDAKKGQPRFTLQEMGFTSMDELMKNLQKALAGLSHQMVGGLTTIIKMEIREYEYLGLKVGDKVYIEISRAEKEGV